MRGAGSKAQGGVKKEKQTKNKDKFEDYKEEIERIPDLSTLPRLHTLIMKVRAKREENSEKLDLLGAAYDQLKKKIKEVRDEQNNTANASLAVAEAPPAEKKK
tara:strand:+ start:79 stop:387 length:309 start_codon:yes stop_codon:yes gene_type:complete